MMFCTISFNTNVSNSLVSAVKKAMTLMFPTGGYYESFFESIVVLAISRYTRISSTQLMQCLQATAIFSATSDELSIAFRINLSFSWSLHNQRSPG